MPFGRIVGLLGLVFLEVYREHPEIYREKPEAYSEQPEFYREKPEVYREQPEVYKSSLRSSKKLTEADREAHCNIW